MEVRVRHSWWQKHPTPANPTVEFKWFPTLPPDMPYEPGTLTALASWSISPVRFAWVRSFSSSGASVADQRAYTGRVVSWAEPSLGSSGTEWVGAIPEVLALIAACAPPASPYDGAEVDRTSRIDDAREPASTPGLSEPESLAWARAVWSGGPIAAVNPSSPELIERLGQLQRWLPAADRGRSRTGTFAREADVGARTHGGELVVTNLARAWRDTSGVGVRTWSCLGRIVEQDGFEGLHELLQLFQEISTAFSKERDPRLLLRVLRRAGLENLPERLLDPGYSSRDNWNHLVRWWLVTARRSLEPIVRFASWRELLSTLQWLASARPAYSFPYFHCADALVTESLLPVALQVEAYQALARRVHPLEVGELATSGGHLR